MRGSANSFTTLFINPFEKPGGRSSPFALERLRDWPACLDPTCSSSRSSWELTVHVYSHSETTYTTEIKHYGSRLVFLGKSVIKPFASMPLSTYLVTGRVGSRTRQSGSRLFPSHLLTVPIHGEQPPRLISLLFPARGRSPSLFWNSYVLIYMEKVEKCHRDEKCSSS